MRIYRQPSINGGQFLDQLLSEPIIIIIIETGQSVSRREFAGTCVGISILTLLSAAIKVSGVSSLVELVEVSQGEKS